MSPPPDLNIMARRVIDRNHYMTVATKGPDGEPRLSPVFYTAARYTDLYWVSSPDAQHSRNLTDHPDVRIVIFDSSAPVGEGEAVYLEATARAVGDWAFAARMAQLMLDHDPNYAGTHYALALVAQHDGNTDTARREFDIAVKAWAMADKDLPELGIALKR